MNNSSSKLQFSTHADRLFVESNKQALRGIQVLPTEPSEWNPTPQNAWSVWDEASCVVVLGEPGSGKSREFSHQHEILKKNGVNSHLTQWRDWHEDDDVRDTLTDRTAFEAALEAWETVWWFVDALDEGRIKSEKAFDTPHTTTAHSPLNLRRAGESVDATTGAVMAI